jgi:hypothetical protein
MSIPVSAKRRRGAQPGNQNSKNNKGNSHPPRNFGNRGGKGAPQGNQYACKPRRSASAILIDDYKSNSEALSWIEEHRMLIDALDLGDEKRVDRATRDGHFGFTPERLAERGAELRAGLCSAAVEELNESLAA